ncbi:MAG: class I SAM-dependent DNA methyltransferase [Candidatus Promineifilaceae bacterium]
MTPQQFVQKWSRIRINELAIAQAHFFDVCALVGHTVPYSGDIPDNEFRFEAPTIKPDGKKGRADAFYQGKFIWEYKSAHADLGKAYQQVLRYREALGNPPLLIVSDTQRIIIHTNYTNTVSEKHEITLDNLMHPDNQRKLELCFAHPDEIEAFFKPKRTQAIVTEANARTFVNMADELKAFSKLDDVGTTPEQLAHFIVRILFCLFAEDMDLLPNQLFRQIMAHQHKSPAALERSLRQLFSTMRDGGNYAFFELPYFDGNLFEDAYVPTLPGGINVALLDAARQDWSGVDPVIFGTLFERIIDPAKRAQLGAHYTSKSDILLIVEPVLMQPLEREWDAVRRKADRALRRGNRDLATSQLHNFATRLSEVKVLDPACGSGNFLYVALRRLLDLQKAVLVHAERHELEPPPLSVSPAQLYGIEINPYAHELAQITIWIGYLQWRHENGYADFQEPILQPLNQIERKDAILAYDTDGNPVEPDWPSADVIIGNPPFLGDKKMRAELDHNYVEDLRTIYNDRLSGQSDLVVYWFYKAYQQLQMACVNRVGLISTNSIRYGTNNEVLRRVKQSNDIFVAWDDKEWMLDGASIRVSIVAFDNGAESSKRLNGVGVASINADLTSSVDVTNALTLRENQDLAFLGMMKAGAFDISFLDAQNMLRSSNPSHEPNHNVVKPRVGGIDIVRRNRQSWIIDYGVGASLEEAKRYELPYQHVLKYVQPVRATNRRKKMRERWWIHGESRPGLREALVELSRYIATPEVAKHRIFDWVSVDTVPDHTLHIIAREDDYFFGMLHSYPHEVWSLRLGNRMGVGNDPRYNSSRTFRTFPFPWSPGREPSEQEDKRVMAIAEAARELVTFRQAWLHPPAKDVGVYLSKRDLKRRTLTNMYNALEHFRCSKEANVLHTLEFRDGWKATVKSDFTIAQAQQLDDIHTELDEAVLDAYGWPHNLTNEQILENLLALNLERAAK